MKICIYGAALDEIPENYRKGAEDFGRALAKRGHSLLFGGGKHGCMGAVARGVAAEGGEANVPPVQPATRHVRTLSKNDVTDLIKHLMCVTGVKKQSVTARLPTNTAMMLFLLIADTKNVSHSPEPV